ncbi:MAG TPA: HAD-IB family phosphatase [Niabella sp.]|nr:HAD-IB family phosphatase [Niabella sp.]HQW14027.1 HAD-IB family phosphatase [Niabella sp.]HQX19430.1 HAD-IB family phosphatase [Niabella sp.]HRB05647.1 HAD-IB family phosphatase [Niabella sp.]HRB27338.1 HAD-IB family phosphatase [Niabella sp.]
MKSKKYYIIDFDSTFTQVEALDELARISLKDNPRKEDIYQKIEDYTNMAMEGKLSFTESLAQRVKLLEANKTHLKKLVAHLKKKVSTSFSRNDAFFNKHADEVLIVSGGFKEFITPVVTKFHIKKENIYANTFLFDKSGKIIGYDNSNPLSEEGGKVKLMKQLNLPGELFGIGDGYSDFQLRESGLIKKFFAFTENISRKSVTAKADHVTPSFDEFLYLNKLPGAISYPKNRIVCMVIGKVNKPCVDVLKKEGYTIVKEKDADEQTIQLAGILLIADKSILETKLLKKAKRLKAIGYFGNNMETFPHQLCTDKGIVIFSEGKKPSSDNTVVTQRIINFINKGAINNSSNFPALQLPAVQKAHRIIHIHQNKPGVIARINSLLAEHQINIIAQYLMTNASIGYVIIDINKEYNKELLKELKKIENTIQSRVLY